MSNVYDVLIERNVVWFITVQFLLCLSVSGQNSPLSVNQSYKLRCDASGVYKLNFEWVSDNIGTQLDPRQWQLWTNTPDDVEIPFEIVGIEDNQFGPGDYVLFYLDIDHLADSPYDTGSFVYLITDVGGRATVGSSDYVEPSDIQSSFNHTHFVRYNQSTFNLLHEDPVNSGSGQMWVGIEITNNGSTELTRLLPASIENSNILSAEVTAVVRSDAPEMMTFSVGDMEVQRGISSIDIGDVEDDFGRRVNLRFDGDQLSTLDQSNTPNISVEYVKNSSQAQAWIDQVTLELSSPLDFDRATQTFEVIDDGNVGFISTGLTPTLWSVSADGVDNINYERDGDFIIFNIDPSDRYVVFDPSEDLLVPSAVTTKPEQNLKNLPIPDLLIVYHSDFEEQALRLQQHRRNFSLFDVLTIDTELIYDEFSSGRKSPEAIRAFAQHLYEQDPKFKFLLLFGDGSFDFQHIYSELPDQNFVPTYETFESLDPLAAFPSDDYFALLDDTNPESLRGDLDIAVGRLPVKNTDEAEAIVSKIINYETNPQTLGDWRNQIGFFADDEDFNLHIDDADEIAEDTEDRHPNFVQNKIYWDAFNQVSTPGGNRYPDANEELNRTVQSGLLVMNYLGHGGSLGWSQERVLSVSDINNWTNFNNLPLIITATCSFTGFDDASITSAGEHSILNPVGGAIALFTTVRSVYASQNFRLTSAVYDNLFVQENGQFQTIGEILRKSKNQVSLTNINARKFLLIGDPSMTLAYPRHQVMTTQINGESITTNRLDTVGALDSVRISGIVSIDGLTADPSFQGVMDITIYDKSITARTLQNDDRSRTREFDVFTNVIFQGSVPVESGEFDLSFIVPVDINFSPGQAKISYYARGEDLIDAGGVYDNLVIGGTSANPIQDDEGPEILAWINSRSFRNGDIVNSDPFLIVNLTDESGINLSQVAIGHEITAIVDGDSQNTIILNELFTRSSSIGGMARIQLNDLEPGPHTVEIRAFDIANNLSTVEISFVVDEDQDRDILSFDISPNPTDADIRFSLVHDIDNVRSVRFEMYDTQGRLSQQIEAPGPFASNFITYTNGPRADVSALSSGSYICRAVIENSDGEILRSAFKKLLLLK